jgi:hypothetical protein
MRGDDYMRFIGGTIAWIMMKINKRTRLEILLGGLDAMERKHLLAIARTNDTETKRELLKKVDDLLSMKLELIKFHKSGA